tara:strand:- start:163 stop:285 length:123 start_codon:yes stop_codon:yes gene_type:complete
MAIIGIKTIFEISDIGTMREKLFARTKKLPQNAAMFIKFR